MCLVQEHNTRPTAQSGDDHAASVLPTKLYIRNLQKCKLDIIKHLFGFFCIYLGYWFFQYFVSPIRFWENEHRKRHSKVSPTKLYLNYCLQHVHTLYTEAQNLKHKLWNLVLGALYKDWVSGFQSWQYWLVLYDLCIKSSQQIEIICSDLLNSFGLIIKIFLEVRNCVSITRQ